MKIVLASQSPRRRELLKGMGLEFIVTSPHIDEGAFSGPSPEELVKTLAQAKAQYVAQGEDPDAIVIGSDTVVVLEGEILGKPASPQEAAAMLTALSGKTHTVCTGISLCQGEQTLTQAESVQVTFRPLTQGEIAAYVATGEPLDKAGAYGIQGLGSLLVEGIQGDYFAVVGLPVCRLGQMLRRFGVDCLGGG